MGFVWNDGNDVINEKDTTRRMEHEMEYSTATAKPSGLIRYVLLVVSHPVQPTTGQMSKFLTEVLPEFTKQPKDTGIAGLLHETKPMHMINMPKVATEAFGEGILDESKYIYRTMHFGLNGGEAKCFVVYDIASKCAAKWWQIWK